MKRLLVWGSISFLAACGGRYELDRPDGDSGDSGGAGGGGAANGRPGVSDVGPGSGSTVTLPTHELGQCVPGFDRASNPTRPCSLLTKTGVCFDTTDAACNCICPTNKTSACYSPFDSDPSEPTPIYCD